MNQFSQQQRKIKKKILILLAATLLLSFQMNFLSQPVVRAETASSISNGSFESVVTNTLGSYWHIAQAEHWNAFVFHGTPEITVSNAVYHSGTHALHVSSAVTGRAAVFQDITGLTPGQLYKVSSWLKTADIQSVNGAFIRLAFFDANNQILGDQPVYGRLTGTNDWTYEEGIVQLPDQTVRVRLEAMFDSGTGQAWFDDVNFIAWTPVQDISLSSTLIEMSTGTSTVLQAEVIPSHATDHTISWSTSDPSIATVLNGVVTAHSSGQAIITAQSADGGHSRTALVSVDSPVVPTDGVELEPKRLLLPTGSSFTLDALFTPPQATDQRLNWLSSDATVASVADGTVSGVTPGSAVITAETVNGGHSASTHVQVVENLLTNGTFQATAPPTEGWTTASPVGWNRYAWNNSTPLMTVSDTVYYESGSALHIDAATTSRVAVYQNVTNFTPGQWLKLSGWIKTTNLQSVNGALNGAFIRINFMDSNNQLVDSSSIGHWTDTTDWVKVEDMVQAPASAARINIELLFDNATGSAWFDDIRLMPWTSVESMLLHMPATSLQVGHNIIASATISPSSATDSRVRWYSTDPTVAEVDHDGVITALQPGITAIRAVSEDSGVSDTAALIVGSNSNVTLNDVQVQTPFTTPAEGILSGTANQGNPLSYYLLSPPASGTAEVLEDGTWQYTPPFSFQGSDHFLVYATDGNNYDAAKIVVDVQPPAYLLNDFSSMHARLHLNTARIAALKQAIAPGGSHNSLWITLKGEVDQRISSPPPAYYVSSSDEEGWQRAVGETITLISFAYLLTDDPVYLNAAKDWAVTASQYPTWGRGYAENADLAAGHLLYGLATFYDWLYDDLDAQTRTTVKNVLLERGNIMYQAAIRDDGWKWTEHYLQNHMWVATTGLTAAALALYDEDTSVLPWIDISLDKILKTMDVLGEDGATHEGYSYQQYGLEYLLKFMDLSRKMMNIDLFRNTWFKNAVKYQIYMATPKNSWVFPENHIDIADDVRVNWYGPDYLLHVLAAEYNDGHAQRMAREVSTMSAPSSLWMGLLWYDPSLQEEPASIQPTLHHFDDIGIVSARSDWSGDESLIAFKSGPPLGHKAMDISDPLKDWGSWHVHPDANHFVFHGNGEWLLRDDGYAYKHTSNHNTLLIDGQGQFGEGKIGFTARELQQRKAKPTILKAEYGPIVDHIIGEASEAYPTSKGLTKYKRHLLYVKPDILIVVDDIETTEPRELELRFHPASQNAFSMLDGSIYIPGQQTKLRVTPLTETVSDTAAVYAPSYNRSNTAEDKLAIQVKNKGQSSWKNAIAFTYSDMQYAPAPVTWTNNGDEWIFEAGDYEITLNLVTNEVQASMLDSSSYPPSSNASLSNILLNGKPITSFQSETLSYNIPRTWKTPEANLLAIPQDLGANISVAPVNGIAEQYQINVISADGTTTKNYIINIEETNLLSFASVTATGSSAFPLLNLYDSNPDTAWSGLNGGDSTDIIFNLGEVRLIDRVAIDWYLGDQRQYNFNIDLSIDGQTWNQVWSGPSSGTLPTEEVYDIIDEPAQYIRIRGNGNTKSAYTSIYEVSVIAANSGFPTDDEDDDDDENDDEHDDEDEDDDDDDDDEENESDD
ncbi:Ig-like domain-containing protein [Paenibacillus chungangensis]|uniref:Ig-like domain-containing protein n=1 Tax=Paenibacillus chungangensis TaxID=696535 RepID=A0ABW3HQK5_9BACL